ncbi:MAG: hypothetical protein J6S72_01590 [Lachnospiraceae bacterium]|nr:hypothetical protein [Lachnospiraceae bacterium]
MNKDSDRQADSGITREELKDMLQKYNIGKKPLSKLLGWGETTILLYLREDEEELPDNEYTRRLKNLYTHTTGFLSLLNSGQNRISSVAKRRSIDAVRQLFPTSPIFDAAEYVVGVHRKLASEFGAESMSLVRLQTILFWSQVASLCLYNEVIFEDDYAPGRGGMPYRAVAERMQTMGCIVPDGLYTGPGPRVSSLTDEKKAILAFITEMFEWYGTSALEELLEAEHFRLCGPKTARKRRLASKEVLKKCYGEVFKQAKVKKLKDIDGYMMKRVTFIRNHKEK